MGGVRRNSDRGGSVMHLRIIPLKVNCPDHVEGRCAANYPGIGPTPSGGSCELCPHRRPREPGAAVAWIDAVAICLGARTKYPASSWLQLLDARIGLRGDRIIVPVEIAEAAKPFAIETDTED